MKRPYNFCIYSLLVALLFMLSLFYPGLAEANGNAWWDNAWSYRVPLTVSADGYERYDKPVEATVNFTQLLNSLGQSGALDLNSIRVVEVDAAAQLVDADVPFQFDPDPDFDAMNNASGTVVFIMEGATTANATRYYHIYFDVTGGSFSPPSVVPQVTLTDNVVDEGQNSFRVDTTTGAYYYHKQGAGFSSLLDLDSNDWINYHPTGGSAGNFRGIPNLVHPNDGGHFHPGATSSTSTILNQGPIKVTLHSITNDNQWESTWEIYPHYARLTVLKKAPGTNYWFLYEGTPGGSLETGTDFVVRSDGTQTLALDNWEGDLVAEEWAYFADPNVGLAGRALFVAHHQDDSAVDSYLPMEGNMTVLGIGRQASDSLMDFVPAHFTIGLMDETTFSPASKTIYSAYKDLDTTLGAAQQKGGGANIHVWYGLNQQFGHLGNPQQWVNVVGNVSDSDGVASLTYSLNSGPELPLSVGPDGYRLAAPGDFNVEIDYADLLSGTNQVTITATDSLNNETVEQVNVQYTTGNTWPQPYTIDWSSVTNIQDVAQVVDGLWTIEGDTVRPVGVDENSYDRLIAIGDTTWLDYEVTVPITIHQFFGDLDPGTGILVRWNGHGNDAQQPHYAHPLGGLGWFRKRPTSSVYRLNILGNGGIQIATDYSGRVLDLETPYIFKMRVETEAGGQSLYSFKVWEASESEPAGWDLSGYGNDLDPDEAHGSLMLVAHRTDASFGDVTITPLTDNTPPILSNIQVTPGETMATVTWTTNEPATSNVIYGQTPAYEIGLETDSALVTSHTISLTGLLSDTLHHYQVSSVDGSSNSASSTDLTFTTIAAGSAPSGIVSDDFNTCSLDTSLWTTFTDPVGDVSMPTTDGTHMLFSVPGGTRHDLYTGALEAPRIMQAATNEDFEIEVKFDSPVVAPQYQMQGIVIEEDFNNFLRFDFYSTNSRTNSFAAAFVGGSVTTSQITDIAALNVSPLYMRVKREGNQWTQTYSLDGITWLPGASFSHPMTVNRVGLFVGNAGSNPAHTAEIDYFFNTASPIDPEDGNQNTVTTNVIPSGSGTVTKTPDQSTYACNQQVKLTAIPNAGWNFANWSGAPLAATNPTTLTITDSHVITANFIADNNVEITETGGGTSVIESGTTDTYTVSLTVAPTATVTINFVTDGQLEPITPLVFTTLNWNQPQTVTVKAVNDDVVEGLHSSVINHTASSSDPDYNGIAIPQVTVSIIDDDFAGVNVAPTTLAISEDGVTGSYELVLTSEPTATVTINVNPDGQSTAGPGVLTFDNTNWNISQTVTITAVDDLIVEGAHTSTIGHTATSADGNYNGIAVADVTANITDNDVAGVEITETGGSTNVSENGATDTYTVKLTSEPTATVTINVNPDGQSTAGPGVLTFDNTNWNISQTVTITAVDDLIVEGAHTSTIGHTATSADGNYNGIAVVDVTANITDNDVPGVEITETEGATGVSESGTTDTYTVSLTVAPTATVTINFVTDGQLEPVTQLVFTTLNWNQPQTVTVKAINDDVVEGLHSSVINHTASSSDPDYNGIAIPQVTVSIIDDDFAGVNVAPTTLAISEDGVTGSYELVLTSEPTATVTINVNPDGQSTAGPGVLTFDNTNWNISQTVTITAVDDLIVEGAHTSTIGHTATSADGNYNGIAVADVTANITDNDTTSDAGQIFLPIIMGKHQFESSLPDLIPRQLIVEPSTGLAATTPVTLSVVLQNIGTATAIPNFWVDLYINPLSFPNEAGHLWGTVCPPPPYPPGNPCNDDYGLAWQVTTPVAPGQVITLTSMVNDPYLAAWPDTIWPGFFNKGSKQSLWVYVDSWNGFKVPQGFIIESDETNNRLGPRDIIDVAGGGSAVIITGLETNEPFPVRPLPNP